MAPAHPLATLPTPALLLDQARMQRNIARLRAHLAPLHVGLRPHLKTAKSVPVARHVLTGGDGPATVSTLKEAEVFAAAGVKDILYAVGIVPHKLPRVLALRERGCDLTVVLDSIAQADAVGEASRRSGRPLPVLLEIDCDGHRSGLRPDAPALLAVGRRVVEAGAELRGVMTHAGESYGAVGAEALARWAEQERAAVVQAAERLRAAGLPCPVVSVGSTPTAHFARTLDGVTEVRPGVFVFMDLVMAGAGVCGLEDIALSVLTSVIGHQSERACILVDAGWMALSRDRGTAAQAVDQGYGLVCDVEGRVLPDLIVSGTNQEHGIVSMRPGSPHPLPALPVGTLLRILPNHACATAAQFEAYEVLPERAGEPLSRWPRFGGW